MVQSAISRSGVLCGLLLTTTLLVQLVWNVSVHAKVTELRAENGRLRRDLTSVMAPPTLAPGSRSEPGTAPLPATAAKDAPPIASAAIEAPVAGRSAFDGLGASAKAGPVKDRRLSTLATIGTGATSGCRPVTASAGTNSINMNTLAVTIGGSGATSCTTRCPNCFIFNNHAGGLTVQISKCSTTIVGSALANKVLEFIFINADGSNAITIQDDASNTYDLGAKKAVTAFCFEDTAASVTGETVDTLYFIDDAA